MTMARAQLVDLSVTRWYYCVVRCARGASLLGEGTLDRKQWIEDRLEELAQAFAIAVGAFSVLDDRFHVLVRLEPEVAERWSDEEVVRRWGAVLPPRDKDRQPVPVSTKWVRERLKDAASVAVARERLQSLSWFMKSLKEPIARLANREDGVRSAFFESRFKTIAILDDESLLATSVFIDVNPVAAGVAVHPEASAHTSIRQRVARRRERVQTQTSKRAGRGQAADASIAKRLEESQWLCPIEDRQAGKSIRRGIFPGMTLDDYRLMLKCTGRLFHEGETSIPRDAAVLFARLGIDYESWQARMLKLSEGRLLGRFFSASRERLRELASRLGVGHLDNLGSCPTRS